MLRVVCNDSLVDLFSKLVNHINSRGLGRRKAVLIIDWDNGAIIDARYTGWVWPGWIVQQSLFPSQERTCVVIREMVTNPLFDGDSSVTCQWPCWNNACCLRHDQVMASKRMSMGARAYINNTMEDVTLE